MHALQRMNWYVLPGNHNERPWKEMPWPGIFNKVLFCDPVLGVTLELAKIEKGATFPVHYHTTAQTLFLVSGRLRHEGRVLEAGYFDIIPAGERHGGYFGVEESIQFKMFSSVPVYFLENGDAFIYRTDGTMLHAGQIDMTRHAKQQNFLYSG
jgi:hypothetical protein